MTVRGNKGEWSEFYAFIKILTDGQIFAANSDLEIMKDKFFTVLKIIREEKKVKKFYDISKKDDFIVISDEENNNLSKIRLDKIKVRVSKIFSEMKNSSATTFEIALASKTMKDLKCSQIKASSSKKSDLIITINDRISPTFPDLGFSIKSMLGSPSTLLNASGATNFIFEIKGISKDKLNKINSIEGKSKIRDRIKFIKDNGGELFFESLDSDGFRKNLRKIDSNLPEIVAEMLKNYFSSNGVKTFELIDCISKNKKLSKQLDLDRADYEYKIKSLLSAVALGMTPKKEWDGFTKAHGGYIIVKEDGEVICYHLYNRDEFEKYLYRNTKFDTPGSNKHGFGKLYKENKKLKIKLNLQIRFVR